jgi:hypothetical protein
MEKHAWAGKKNAPDAVSALGKFGGFRPESEKMIRTAEIEMNPALVGMIDAWHRCSDEMITEKSYFEMYGRIKMLRYTATDVAAFSIYLGELQNEMLFNFKAGTYLSALINNSEEREFVIHTKHLMEPINHIGYLNSKMIIVEGDAGDDAGARMVAGTLIINGNADFSVGNAMQGGVIIVNGNAEERVGTEMSGGSITIKGNAGDMAACEMTGGEITIEGDARNKAGIMMRGGKFTINGVAAWFLGEGMEGGEIHVNGRIIDFMATLRNSVIGGKIYHKGKLIIDK